MRQQQTGMYMGVDGTELRDDELAENSAQCMERVVAAGSMLTTLAVNGPTLPDQTLAQDYGLAAQLALDLFHALDKRAKYHSKKHILRKTDAFQRAFGADDATTTTTRKGDKRRGS